MPLGPPDALSITGGTVGFSGINSMSLASLAGSAATILQLTNSANSTGLNLTVAGATSTVYNGNITGSGGSLTMVGPSTLTLGGTNTYTGTTTLAGGVLALNNANALVGGGPINFTGGTLRLFNTTDYSSRFLTTGNQNLIVDTNGQNVTFAANLTSSSGTLQKLGAGQLTLTGTNTYNGGTYIIGGVLQFANSNALPFAGTGFAQNSIFISASGALSAISGDATTANGWLNTGDINTNSTGAIALTTASTDTSVDFSITGPNGSYPTLALGALGSVTYNGTITPNSTSVGYLLGATGTLWLTRPLNDSGGSTPLTIVNGGTVVIANSASNWSGATTVQSNATLKLGDGATNGVFPTASISNSGTVIFQNATAGTVSAGITGPAASSLFAYGPSVLEIDGTNNVGVFTPTAGR